jgi:hypothetical protein
VRLPTELWPEPRHGELVAQLADLFAAEPVVLTDRLANAVYFSEAAESLLGDAGAAIVNRTAFSLLGIDDGRPVPEGLPAALLGSRPPWKALVRLPGSGASRWCEASSVQCDGEFVCGLLRIGGEARHG